MGKQQETDEFGVPIKRKSAQVDDFGIPIKKKVSGEVSTSESVTSAQDLNAPPEPSGQNGILGNINNLISNPAPEAQVEVEKLRKTGQIPDPRKSDFRFVEVGETPGTTKTQTKSSAKNDVNVKEIYRGKESDKYDFNEINRNAGYNPQLEDEAYGALVNDYLEYLKNTDENKYETTKSAYDELSAQKASGDLSYGQQEKLRDITVAATNLKNDALRHRAILISDSPELKSFQRKAAILDAENAPEEKYQVAKDESGLTPEMEQAYGESYEKFIDPIGVEHKNNKDFPEIAEAEANKNLTQAARTEAAKEGETEFKKSFSSTVGSGLIGILQIPKIVSDLFGATDYTMVDELYDKISGVKSKGEAEMGALDETGLPNAYKLSRIAGQAAGSMAMFMAGGAGSATKIGQIANTAATNFAVTLPDYYSDAIRLGKNEKEASVDANFFALITSALEGALPDIKFLEETPFRTSMMKAYAGGKTAKESFKLAFEALPDALRSRLKETARGITQEVTEEESQTLGEDVGKTISNAVSDEETQYVTFDPKNYVESALGAFMTRGGTSLFQRPGVKPPETEEMMMDAVDNREQIVADMESVGAENTAEVKQTLDSAAENLDALKSHSSWSKLDKEDQAHALALTQQAQALSEETKAVTGLGIEDKAKTEQIKAIEEELNQIFNPDEKIEEAPVEKPVENEPIQPEGAGEKPASVSETAQSGQLHGNVEAEAVQKETKVAEPITETATEAAETVNNKSENQKNRIKDAKVEEKPEGELKKKSLLNRSVEGTATDEIKSAIEKHGLLYEQEKRADAKKSAKAFIEEVGIDNAVEAVRKSQVDDAAAAYVWSEAIDMVGEELSTEEDPDKREQLQKIEADLVEEFDRKARSGGRFTSALADIYQNSDFGYKASSMKSRYKESNKGYLPEDVEKRIQAYADELTDIKKKLTEAEAREAEQKVNETVVNIREEATRKAPKDKEIKIKLADKIRKAKVTRPGMFAAASPASVAWDGAVELVATSVEAGESLAKAIKKGVEYIKDTDWYKSLTEDMRSEAEREFSDSMKSQEAKVEMTKGKLKIPTSIIREKVQSGISDINELAKSVHDEIKEEFPDVTVRQVKDTITQYGRQIGETRGEIQAQLNQMKKIGRLQSQLEDIQNRIPKIKNTREKERLSKLEIYYRDKIKKELRGQEIQADPEFTKTEQAKERVAKKTKELEARIANKDFSKKVTKAVVADTELIRLRAEQQRVRDEYDRELYKSQLKNRKANTIFWDAAIEVANLLRAAMTTLEFSFVFIQGFYMTLSHPILAARSFLKAVQHGWSEQRAQKWGEFIKSQPWYEQMKKSNLALSEYDARLETREEAFLGGWINHIWDYAGISTRLGGEEVWEQWKKMNPFKAIERAGVGYLNTMRVLRYLDGMYVLEKDGKTFENNKEDFKNMADVINTLTGRGSLGPIEQSHKMKKLAPLAFFSPRNWSSIIKTASPYAFFHFGKMGYKGTGQVNFKPSAAQKMALADFMKATTVTLATVLAFALKFNNDDDDETEVSLDPTDTDYLTIRIGETRIDPFAGRRQMWVLQARLMLGSMRRANDKKAVPLGSDKAHPNFGMLTLEMVENKLSPAAGLGVNYIFQTTRDKKGKLRDSFGKEYDFQSELAERVYPMYAGTIKELYQEQPETVATFMASLAFFGVGVNTYENKKKKGPVKD